MISSPVSMDLQLRRERNALGMIRGLIKRLKTERQGRGLHGLRHTFRTLADETGDPHAVRRIMGHSLPGMSGISAEEISIARLGAVVNHVRSKILPGR